VPTKGKLPYGHVLFVGVPSLMFFDYGEIRKFSETALRAVFQSKQAHSHVAMTMHGVGYGLDEKEAFTAQVAGILECFSVPSGGNVPQKVTIVEQNANRFYRISALLNQICDVQDNSAITLQCGPMGQVIPDAGIASKNKRLIFVAMPYNEQMLDVFDFGIKEPVNNSGCLCERCDREAFTGDVLERIRTRIGEADLVIADMTGNNPNVYLEVGYAWGKGVKTLLIAQAGEELKFDLRTHNCLFYTNIGNLREQLMKFLAALLSDGQPRDLHRGLGAR